MVGGSPPPLDIASSMATLFTHLSNPNVTTSIIGKSLNPNRQSSVDVPTDTDHQRYNTLIYGDCARVGETQTRPGHSAAAPPSHAILDAGFWKIQTLFLIGLGLPPLSFKTLEWMADQDPNS